MDQLPMITFFDAERMAQFWQYVKALMFVVMPILLVVVATYSAGFLIETVRKVFSHLSSKDDEEYTYKYDEKSYNK